MDNKKTKDFILNCLSSVWNFFFDTSISTGLGLGFLNNIFLYTIYYILCPYCEQSSARLIFSILTFLFTPLVALSYFIRNKYTRVPIVKILKFTLFYCLWALLSRGFIQFILLSIELFILCKLYIILNKKFPELFNWNLSKDTLTGKFLNATVFPFLNNFCDSYIYAAIGFTSIYNRSDDTMYPAAFLFVPFIVLNYFIAKNYTRVPYVNILLFSFSYSYFCTSLYLDSSLTFAYVSSVAVLMTIEMCLLCSLYIIVKNLINKKLYL